MKKSALFATLLAVNAFFCACANHSTDNFFYEEALKNAYCDNSFFEDKRAKVDKNDDIIYTGLNVGALARHCDELKLSNYFFDKAEEAYKYDVDLQGLATKGT